MLVLIKWCLYPRNLQWRFQHYQNPTQQSKMEYSKVHNKKSNLFKPIKPINLVTQFIKKDIINISPSSFSAIKVQILCNIRIAQNSSWLREPHFECQELISFDGKVWLIYIFFYIAIHSVFTKLNPLKLTFILNSNK